MKKRPQPGPARKVVREPLKLGAFLVLIFLVVVLASTSAEVAEVAYVVDRGNLSNWNSASQANRLRGVSGSGLAFAMAEIGISRFILGNAHLSIAVQDSRMASLYVSRGDFVQAKPLLEEALAIRERKLGKEHPFSIDSMIALAYVDTMLKNYKEAASLLTAAAKAQAALPGLKKYRPATLFNLASVYMMMRDFQSAEQTMKACVTATQEITGADSVDTAMALHGLANVHIEQRDYKKAEPVIKQAMPILEKRLGANNEVVSNSLLSLGEVELNLGNYDLAESTLQKCLAIRQGLVGKSHPAYVTAMDGLGRAYAAQGRKELARQTFAQAKAALASLPQSDPNLAVLRKKVLDHERNSLIEK